MTTELKQQIATEISERIQAAREAGEEMNREAIAKEVALELGFEEDQTDMPAVSALTDQVISASSRNLDGLEVDVELSDKNMAVHSQADERESLNEGFGLADD